MEQEIKNVSEEMDSRGKSPLKSRTASALSYMPGMPAPQVIASGRGRIAERIVETAAENKIPVVEDAFLAGVLAGSPVGAYIPEQTYRAVAVIFSFLERAEQEKLF